MKAIVRVKYDNVHGNKDFVFCLDNVNEESIYKLLNELDLRVGYSCSYRSIEFINDNDNDSTFKIKQRLLFDMVQLAITSNKLKYYYDDVLFHDKVKLFTVDDDVKELIWLIGDDYTRLLEVNQLDFYKDQIEYYSKCGSLYLIDLVDGTINELVKVRCVEWLNNIVFF